MLSSEVRKAAWNDTSLWLAMIQPRSRRGVSLDWLNTAKGFGMACSYEMTLLSQQLLLGGKISIRRELAGLLL